MPAKKTTTKKSPAGKAAAPKNKVSKKPVINRANHQIDATDQVLGRLASNIAMILRGKNKATFLPHVDAGDFVLVKNVTKIKITGNKREDKIYYHFSGYPGGLKKTAMKDVIAKDSGEVLRRAVWNMLPKNKLRNTMIKRLTITP